MNVARIVEEAIALHDWKLGADFSTKALYERYRGLEKQADGEGLEVMHAVAALNMLALLEPATRRELMSQLLKSDFCYVGDEDNDDEYLDEYSEHGGHEPFHQTSPYRVD